MNTRLLGLLASFALYSPFSILLYCQDQPESYLVTIAQDSFNATGNQILRKSGDQWKSVARFTVPTVSLLLKYRPEVRDHIGSVDDGERFIDLVEDVSSTVSSVSTADGKLWVGFGFYEGEGWEGIGGIGFYEPGTNRIGVLRHPALVDYSVESLMVTDTMIYVQTAGNYEGSSSVGNGVVMIDKRTLLARAIVPPGTSTLWDKDDSVNVGALYNRPIPEILSDRRFVDKPVPQYSATVIESFRTVGLDSFMVMAADEEKSIRDRAAANAPMIQDTLKLPRQDGGWVSPGTRTGVELHSGISSTLGPDGIYYLSLVDCPVNGVAFFRIQVTGAFPFSENFGIKPVRVYPGFIDDDTRFMVVQEGDSWVRETHRTRVTIVIDKLETRTKTCIINRQPREIEYFGSVVVRIDVRELQE